MREMVCILNGMAVSAPVLMGTVLMADILGSGADVVATQDVPAS
jgi:CxxC motif-containing protein